MSDDPELLRRFSETRSELAFTEFVRRHINLVYFTALRRTDGDSALAQDVAQAVFALAARQSRSLLRHAAMTGWLHTTTRYVAARALRKEQTRQRYEQAAVAHDLLTGDSAHDWAQLRPVIDDALDDLEARDRTAILARFFEGHAFADLGVTWQISPDAARMRVDRALDKLRVALERRGIQSVSTALAVALAAQGSLAAPAGIVASVSSAALAASAVSSGAIAFFTIMSGTKTIVATATVLVALAAGTAVFQRHAAAQAELRLDEANRELTVLRAQLARAEQRRSSAETVAAEAEKDNADLLAAVQAARTRVNASAPNPQPVGASRTSSPNDPLAQTLRALFPSGIVATVGTRTITVDDVRRQVAARLPQAQQLSATPAELEQRLYALQNAAIADLVTRQLDVAEFHNPASTEPAKHLASEFVDALMADQVKERFNNDQTRLLASLDAQGMTLAQYRQSVEETLISAYMRTQQRRLTPGKDAPPKSPTP